MIIDRIEEAERYFGLHPLLEEAFSFLTEAPDLEAGRYELDDGLFASLSEFETKPIASMDLEAHERYIDLHCCLAGGERISWAHTAELNRVRENDGHDNILYNGHSTSISVRPGMFYIMFPSDAHRTGGHHEFPKQCRKVVVKIPVEPW